ncbi:MAG: dTDP-glucose 4,6-dehydratase [Planctomycetota bacterium]|nr:MAG: dTDP-glucose 4,6-dehydratase [Planctomycetota bacterium]
MAEAVRSVRTVLVTGGAGFVGSNLVRLLLAERPAWRVVNLDKLSYAGAGGNLDDLADEPRYELVRADVCDAARVFEVFRRVRPQLVFHLAAESHVDRSIHAAAPFLRTNVEGTRVILDAARALGEGVRVLYCSTDEVYGDLGPRGRFTEQSPLCPSSPYAVSKAAGDMLARAYHRTFGLDVVVSRCSNNYGPYQYPEKLIPLMITNALEDRELPVYGDGLNVRDWIHVEDHCRGMLAVAERAAPGAVYNLGGSCEKTNLEVVREILRLTHKPMSLIRFVPDRPGHDRRYAVDASRAERELGWRPAHEFARGLEATVRWYREHQAWWRRLKDEGFRAYYERQYGTAAAGRPAGTG